MSAAVRALDRNERVTVVHQGVVHANLVLPRGKRCNNRAINHPAVGMWADRRDLADVPGHARALRRWRVRAH